MVKEFEYFDLGEEEVSETNVVTSVAAGVLSGLIKVPVGLVSVAAEIGDAVRGEGISVDESYVAQLEKFIDTSVVGDVMSGLEDKARNTAAGRITEALVQLGLPVAKGAKIGGAIAAKTINAIQKGKRMSLNNKNLLKAARQAEKFNKRANIGRYAATSTGAAAGSAFIYDIEDIGTFGDVFEGGPTEIDRERKDETDDEATRRLANRLRFATEGVLIAPFAYGGGKALKALAEKGKKLAFSKSKLERNIDAVLGAPFRPRGKKSQELFEAQMRVGGEEGSAAVLAKDIIKDIDGTFKNIFSKSKDVARKIDDQDKLVTEMDKLLKSGDDAFKNKKFVFQGFGKKQRKEFEDALKNIGVKGKDKDALLSSLIAARKEFNNFKTQIAKGGNVTDIEEFGELLSERFKNTLSNDYKIFTNKSLLPLNAYKPSADSIDRTADVIQTYTASHKNPLTGKSYKISKEDAIQEVEAILKRVKKDPVTHSPVFDFEDFSAMRDQAAQKINIGRAITANKFEKGALFQKKEDVQAFRDLFGEMKDARRTIVNSMKDLSSLTARDNFYNTIRNVSEASIAQAKPGIVYDSYRAATQGLPNRDIITRPLTLKSQLGENVLSNPLTGKYTSREYADALNFAEKMPFDKLMQENWYRYLFAIPKGLAQVSKTVLGPFTHARNFFSATAFSLGTGNLFKNPKFILDNYKRSFNTIQPQLIYRNLPKDQAFYRFLLDEGVVNSSSTFQDVQGLLKDIAKGGDVVERVFGKMGKRLNKTYKGAQDLYVAEDDFFKIYNFLAEADNLAHAYRGAVKKGLIKKMPSELAMSKEAADIVRNTVPNYAYVNDFLKGISRSPLGNFVSFPAEIIRTSVNIVERGVREVKDPIKRSIGARRLLGYSTALAVIPPMVTEAYRGLYGITRDQVSAVRRFLPDWSKESTIVTTKDKEGDIFVTDFSHGFAYDTVLNPAQSIIANVEAQPEEPLIKGLVDGVTKGVARLVDPFISESIWLQAGLDLYARGGKTLTGGRVWNPEEPEGDKYWKGLKHLVEAVGPLSIPQLRRLGISATVGRDPRTGQELDFTGEMGGFFGFRNVKLDLEKSLGYKITDYRVAQRNDQALLPRPQGNVKPQDIIDGYIAANKAWFRNMQEMRKDIQALETLEFSDKTTEEIFKRRGLKKDYEYLQAGIFKPLALSKGMIEAYIRNAEDKGYENPLDRETLIEIDNIYRSLSGLDLDEEKPKEVLEEESETEVIIKPLESKIQTPPLPQTPMPQVANIGAPQDPQTGLTRSESALLSPSEQEIARRT